MRASPILRIGGFTLSCAGKTIVTCEIRQGATIAILGPNGAGKTTLLRAILGERGTGEGNIFVGDHREPVIRWSVREVSEWISYLPQEPVYPVDLLVRDYLSISFLARRERPRPENRIRETTELASGLEFADLLNRRLGEISSGERQRVHLGRVLLQRVPLRLFDEPTNHLDPGAKARFWQLLASHSTQRGSTNIIVTHDLEFVSSYCEFVLAIPRSGESWFGKKGEFLEKGVGELYGVG